MSSKSDLIPAARGPHLIQQSRKFFVAMLTLFAVLGGWTGSAEDMEKMGISPGPTHS
jgi:hypothetical protein